MEVKISYPWDSAMCSQGSQGSRERAAAPAPPFSRHGQPQSGQLSCQTDVPGNAVRANTESSKPIMSFQDEKAREVKNFACGGLAREFTAIAALAEDLSSIPNTLMSTHNCLTPTPGI